MDSANIRGVTVLVTGASGFIGSHLVERLLAEGANVRCLHPADQSSRGRCPPSCRAQGAKPVLGDLLTGAGMSEALDGASIVFHLAGVTKALHTADYYEGNVRATENLLRAMSAGCARFVHVSSLAADGSKPGRRSSPRGSRAASAYPLRQIEAGRRAAPCAPPRWPTRDRHPSSGRLWSAGYRTSYRVFKAAASGALVRIGSGESYFSFIYVADLVDGLILAADAARRPPGRTTSSPTRAGLLDRVRRYRRHDHDEEAPDLHVAGLGCVSGRSAFAELLRA